MADQTPDQNLFEVKLIMSTQETDVLKMLGQTISAASEALNTIATKLESSVQALNNLQTSVRTATAPAGVTPAATTPGASQGAAGGGAGRPPTTVRTASDEPPEDPKEPQYRSVGIREALWGAGQDAGKEDALLQRKHRNSMAPGLIGPEDAGRLTDPTRYGGRWTFQDILTLGSYATGAMGYQQEVDPETGAMKIAGTQQPDGNGGTHIVPMYRNLPGVGRAGGGMMAGASRALGMAARALPVVFATTMAAKYASGLVNQAFEPSRAGMQMGYERGITGEGAENRAEGMLDAATESWFGLNPYLGFGQAKEISEFLEQQGVRNQTGRDREFEMLAGVSANTGLKPEQYGALYEEHYRYGATSMADFERVLRNIPSAAQAARMNLAPFVESLNAVTSGIAQRQGLTQTQVTQQIMPLAQAGFTPEAAGNLVNDQMLTMSAAAHQGLSLGELLLSPGRGVYQISELENVFRTYMGKDLKDLPHDKNLQARVTEALYLDPSIFGGQDFGQLLQLANDSQGFKNRSWSGGMIQKLQNSLGKDEAGNEELRGVGIGSLGVENNRRKLEKRVAGTLKMAGRSEKDIAEFFDNHGVLKGNSAEEMLREANKEIEGATRSAVERADQKVGVTIKFQGFAQRVLEQALADSDVSNNNQSNKGPGRKVYPITGSIVRSVR